MTPADLETLLGRVAGGDVNVADAMERLRTLPFESVGFATLDHHRELRSGSPEVIFGAGKTPDQIAVISRKLVDRGANVLCTRTTPEAFAATEAALRGVDPAPETVFHADARAFTATVRPAAALGRLGVVCAGTSDLPVAEEAAITGTFYGAEVTRLYDVGVAGIHRVLDAHQTLRDQDVVIVVAGLEGALPSVVGGLLGQPVIAVPTSVGYGASFGGLAALLGMLNSCASGVTVVNIDNGFGAASAAQRILRACASERSA